MAVARIIEPPITAQEYDKVSERLGASNAMPPPGMLLHVAGPSENGWRIIETWETRDGADAWAEKVGAVIGELGMGDGQPPKVTFFDVHNMMQAGS